VAKVACVGDLENVGVTGCNEVAARMQVLAQSIGEIKPLDPVMAREAHDYRLKPRAVAATFYYFARRALKLEHDVLD
jgi:L-fuculose-phosphate aldolase